MSYKPVDYLVPAAVGGFWGWWLYRQQDHRQTQPNVYPDNDHLSPYIDRSSRGKLGLITAIVMGSLCSFGLNKLCDSPLLGSQFKPAAWIGFFSISYYISENKEKALPKLIKATFLSCLILLCLKRYLPMTQAKTLTSSSKENFYINSCGYFWGFILYLLQDHRPTARLLSSNLENNMHEFKNYMRNSVVGSLGASVLSCMFLDSINSSTLALDDNPHKTKIRMAILFSYFLKSCPTRLKDFNAMESTGYAAFTIMFLLFQGTFLNQTHDAIQDLKVNRIFKGCLGIVPPCLWGVVWGLRAVLHSKMLSETQPLSIKVLKTIEFIVCISASILMKR